jgi:hypothetical protein
MRVIFKRSIWAIVVVAAMVQAPAALGAVSEWSDIPFVEGQYSRIYFDYVTVGGSGTFYCMNDWMTNQNDGGVNGGLKPDEYNRFNFSLAGSNYEIRIYPDGSHQVSGGTLNNFASACSWTTTPNLSTAHTTWEFSFEVDSGTITTFQGCDPPGPVTIPNPNPPPVPAIVTGGPSAFAHWVDGEFADSQLVSTLAGDPSRSYQDPVRDPWFSSHDGGWTLVLKSGGGVEVITPEPVTLALLALGGVVLSCRRQRRCME